MAVTKCFLSRAESRALEDLVEKHKEEIEKGKWTQLAFADFASKRMQRPLTPSNVRSAAKTMGVSFPRGSNSAALRSAHQLRAAVRLLAKEIVSLKMELGRTVRPEVLLLSQEGEENGE